MDILIRKEEKKDYNDIFDVNRLAFGQEEESRLVNRIRNGSNFIPDLSLVAEKDGKIIGHILFSRIKIKGNSIFECLALAPMAIVPEFQKKGVGSQLIEAGISKAKELNYKSIIVLGHKNYYPRFGFKKASKYNIKCPFEVPEEAFMVLELSKNALKDKAGTVIYPPEFK
jgi:predicted N-acetyltransferase YhbS